MQSTVSVSKGCFLTKNGIKKNQNKDAKKLPAQKPTSLLSDEYKLQRWYQAFIRVWHQISSMHHKRQTDGYTQTMDYLIEFVQQSYVSRLSCNIGDKLNMPTTALLTGINQPDHYKLFKTFSDLVHFDAQSLVSIIQSRDCPNMKAAIETMVSGLIDSNFDLNDNVSVRNMGTAFGIFYVFFFLF